MRQLPANPSLFFWAQGLNVVSASVYFHATYQHLYKISQEWKETEHNQLNKDLSPVVALPFPVWSRRDSLSNCCAYPGKWRRRFSWEIPSCRNLSWRSRQTFYHFPSCQLPLALSQRPLHGSHGTSGHVRDTFFVTSKTRRQCQVWSTGKIQVKGNICNIHSKHVTSFDSSVRPFAPLQLFPGAQLHISIFGSFLYLK